MDMDEPLVIAGRSFRSRLLVGTGKYDTLALMRDALAASGTEIVTVAVRRVNLDRREESLLAYVDPGRYQLLPNTAGSTCVEEAVRVARLARAAGLSSWIKLEVIPADGSLLPDPVATVEAAELLIREGFVVLPYTSDDHHVARRLVEMGCATVMPFGSAIGTGLGVTSPERLLRLIDVVGGRVPVVVDAGIGSPADAARAMELGADAVLVNTAIARAGDPVAMAGAMAAAVEAGRTAHLAGIMPRSQVGAPSSPVSGVVGRGAP